MPRGSQLDIAGFLLTYQKSLRLRSTSELERTFTRFIRCRRAMIAEMVTIEQLAIEKPQTSVDLQFKMNALLPSFAELAGDPNLPADRPQDIDLSNLDETEPEYCADSSELDAAKHFLLDGHEYTWLISRLRRQCAMLSTGDTSSLVRTELTHALDNTGDLSLKLHWDPEVFIYEQYESSANRKLANTVCLVGNEVSAYAATCSDYLGLVWSDLGRAVLRCLDTWLSEGSPDSYESEALRGLGINCRVSSSNGWLLWSLKATATELVVEVGEIICFLATVCRTSRPGKYSEAQVESCIPQIIRSPSGDSTRELLIEPIYGPLIKNTEHAGPTNGSCWHLIFWNPVLALGYPVPIRESVTAGVQISIELFAGLTQITRALIYDDTLMLKGFCNMLIPTQIFGSTIVWHYLLSGDFTWMSHNEAKHACGDVAKVDFQMFEAATTHVIGWVTSSRINTGRTTTDFDSIEYTGDDVVGPGYAIDGLTVNVAKYLGASIKIVPAQKDSRLLHAPMSQYELKINTASKMNVIFYDTTTRRAWLVGGDDALLYLSRSAVSHPEGRKPRHHQHTSPQERFKHADLMAPKFSTSRDILLDEDNRKLVIYDNRRDSSKIWRFEDEVGAMFEVLGQMSDRRANLRNCETKQWELGMPCAHPLIGIGCLDLISGQQTLRPCCRKLHSTSSTCLRMADTIDSVNIIGAGLAEMIQPTAKLRSSAELPIGQDILIAPTERISLITRMYGRQTSGSVEITCGVVWQDPMASFHADPCSCGTDGALGCCKDPIVNLLRHNQVPTRGLGLSLDQVLETHPSSAVAFGAITTVPESRVKSRSKVVSRTSSAIQQILHRAANRGVPLRSSHVSSAIPGAPPTPNSSSPETVQPCSDDQTSETSWRSMSRTTTSNITECTSSKAAQIWLHLRAGRSDEAKSLILPLLNSGTTVEHIDDVCYDNSHSPATTGDLQETMLGFASISGDFYLVRFLVQLRFSVHKTNSLGISPLEEAALSDRVAAMRELLRSSESLALDKALIMAVRAGTKDAAVLLLEHGRLLECRLQLDEALQEACDVEQIPLVHLLLGNGADPNFDSARVFRDALANGSPHLVGALLQYDIDKSFILAMRDAMENLTKQPGRCHDGIVAKLSHLKRKCVAMETCISDKLKTINLGEKEAEAP